MLEYLLDAYKLDIYNMQKRRFKELTKKEIGLLIMLVSVGLIGIVLIFIFANNTYFYFIDLISLIIVAGIIFKVMISDSIKDYKNNLQNYHSKLNKLRNTLKEREFNLYKKEKLQKLIELCDEKLNEKDPITKLTKIFIKIVSITILPICTFILSKGSQQLNYSSIIRFSGLIIFAILYIVGICFIIYPFFEHLINKQKYIIKSLRHELNDIIMNDFS